MGQITVLFTKREWHPGSYAIRWGLPVSRFKVASASHCLIRDGDYLIEATMEGGEKFLQGCVRRRLASEALEGLTVVAEVTYNVPDAEAGLAWARTQVGKPYDWRGAFGLALVPTRNWMEPDKWFCFELAAATLVQAGRQDFREDAGHISGNLLLAVKP